MIKHFVKKTCPIALTLIIVFGMMPGSSASAREVPYSSFHVVDSTIDHVTKVDAADLDGDGDLDVLAAAKLQNQLIWYRNSGDGSAWGRMVVANDYGVIGDITAADINSDGKLDILLAHNSNHIDWWENIDGHASSWLNHNIGGSQDAYSIQAIDMDGDGDLDVLAGDRPDDNVDWWENDNGNGLSWSQHTIEGAFDGVISERAGDIDGDGDMDVLAAGDGCDCIYWWENTNGSTESWQVHTFRPGYLDPSSVWLDDLDQDGSLDFLASAALGGQVTWWDNLAGNGNILMEHTIRSGFSYAMSVETADMDGDGDHDVLATANDAHTASWFENGAGWAEHVVDLTPGSGANDAHAADLDGDGDLDVLLAFYDANQIRWRENVTIHRNAVYPVQSMVVVGFDGAQDADLADLDGDGDPDMLGASFLGSDLLWWENQGLFLAASSGPGDQPPGIESWSLGDPAAAAEPPGYSPDISPGALAEPSFVQHVIDLNVTLATAAVPADIDGDGSQDVAGASYLGEIAWWDNTDRHGTSWTKHVVTGSFSGVVDLAAADLDSDGDIDLVGSSENGDVVSWWDNRDGVGTEWSQGDLDTSFVNPIALGVADIDQDGALDVLGAGGSADAVVWWRNVGGAGHTWERVAIDLALDGASAVAVGDLDNDGSLDVVAGGKNAYTCWYKKLNRAGTAWSRSILGFSTGATYIMVVDADQDGDQDVFASIEALDKVVWVENFSGPAQIWVSHQLSGTFDGPRKIASGDFNRDSVPDILTASYNQDMVTLHLNLGGQVALKTNASPINSISPGAKQLVLWITAMHRGSGLDADAEIASFDLLFEHSAGDPLSTVEANHIISRLQIYQDAGPWGFDPAFDTLVKTVEDLSLSAGRQTVTFTDGSPDVRVSLSSPYPPVYFVVLEAAHDADQWPVHQCIVTHKTSASRVEDRSNDIPLLLEYEPTISTNVIYFDAIRTYLPLLTR